MAIRCGKNCMVNITWRTMKIASTAIASLASLASAAAFAAIVEKPLEIIAAGAPSKFTADADTCFLLEPDVFDFVDKSGNIQKAAITVKNGEMFDDECGLTVLRFGEQPGSVTVQDKGRISFKDGMTVEAWIYLEADIPAKESYGIASKTGKDWWRRSFDMSVKMSGEPTATFSLGYLGFEGEKLDFKVLPGREKRMALAEKYIAQGNTMNGLARFPKHRWTHVAFTYDRALRILRTWVDGGVDREAINPWYEISSEVIDDDNVPVVLFSGAKNMRVASVRYSKVAREIGPVAPFLVYECDMAYGDHPVVAVVPASRDIPFPVEVAIDNIHPPYANATYRYTLSDTNEHFFAVPPHQFRNVPTDVVVRFLDNGREFYRYKGRLMNASAGSPASWKFLRGAPWENGPKRPDWWINKDNTISYKNKPVFPLLMTHVTTNDFEFVASLGFTMIGLTAPKGVSLDPYFARAAELGITLLAPDDKDGRQGEGFIAAFDEPWGFSFDGCKEIYRNLRAARSRPAELPVYGVQNNAQRNREMAQMGDIIGIDPYCGGRSPLRFVYDKTYMALRDCGGLKPVFTYVDSYGTAAQRPIYDELRTKVYLAVIGGASAVGFYAWDEGDAKGATNTRNMPEQIEIFRLLLAELKEFTPVLATPNLADKPAFEPTAPRGFFGCAKKHGDKSYLILSSDLFAIDTRKGVFKSAAGKTAKLLYGPKFEGAAAELVFDAEGAAAITLPPLGTAVYEF